MQPEALALPCLEGKAQMVIEKEVELQPHSSAARIPDVSLWDLKSPGSMLLRLCSRYISVQAAN